VATPDQIGGAAAFRSRSRTERTRRLRPRGDSLGSTYPVARGNNTNEAGRVPLRSRSSSNPWRGITACASPAARQHGKALAGCHNKPPAYNESEATTAAEDNGPERQSWLVQALVGLHCGSAFQIGFRKWVSQFLQKGG
jgi:hypothetical protein